MVDGCQTGPLCIVYDATTDQGSPALVGFIAGSNSIKWQRKQVSGGVGWTEGGGDGNDGTW